MLATTQKLLVRLERVRTILTFLRRTWPLEEPLDAGLAELEGEVGTAHTEAGYLGALLDEATAVAARIEATADELDSELDAWTVQVVDRLKVEELGKDGDS